MKVIIFTEELNRAKEIRDVMFSIIVDNLKFIVIVDYDREKDHYWGQAVFEKDTICFLFKTEEIIDPDVYESVKEKIMKKLSFEKEQIIVAYQL